MKILIVDDEESIRRVLRMLFEAKGFVVYEVENGRSAIEAVRKTKPNIVVLDLGLPDMSGAEVLSEIRIWSKVPIIVLTVTDDEMSRVSLLEAGADDYITKPFSSPELLARVNVALRHSRGEPENTPVFQSGPLNIDLPNRTVKIAEQVVRLTTTEFFLVAALVRSAGRNVKQDELLQEVWGVTGLDNPHYLRIYIGQLRKKIEVDPSAPVHIITEPGVGYRIV